MWGPGGLQAPWSPHGAVCYIITTIGTANPHHLHCHYNTTTIPQYHYNTRVPEVLLVPAWSSMLHHYNYRISKPTPSTLPLQYHNTITIPGCLKSSCSPPGAVCNIITTIG